MSSRRGRETVAREKEAYDEGDVFERSMAWNMRVPHVFSSPNTVRGEEAYERLIRDGLRGGARVLETGCGDGNTARQAVELGASSVLALDLSERFVERARERGDADGRIEFRVHDLHEPIAGSFDFIVGRAILHHADWRPILERLYSENLQPGGRMLFMEPMAHPMTVAFHRLVRSAHTPDEYPLGRKDVRWLDATFPSSEVHPINLLSFPAGILSSYVFKRPDNLVTRAADALDRLLVRLRVLRPYGRQGIIVIDKPAPANGARP